MKLALLFAATLVAAPAAPAARSPWFSGCITYRLEAHNAEGEVLETSFGTENKLLIRGNSF